MVRNPQLSNGATSFGMNSFFWANIKTPMTICNVIFYLQGKEMFRFWHSVWCVVLNAFLLNISINNYIFLFLTYK